MFGKAYDVLDNGKFLFPSWEAAIAYIELYSLRNFRLERQPNGKAELEIFNGIQTEGGSKAG